MSIVWGLGLRCAHSPLPSGEGKPYMVLKTFALTMAQAKAIYIYIYIGVTVEGLCVHVV